MNSIADIAAHRARRLSWITLGMGTLVLVALGFASAYGYPAPWTSWLLAVVLTTNPTVYLISHRWQALRAAGIYYRAAAVATLITCVGMAVRLWHR